MKSPGQPQNSYGHPSIELMNCSFHGIVPKDADTPVGQSSCTYCQFVNRINSTEKRSNTPFFLIRPK
jgi:hypothetical protein